MDFQGLAAGCSPHAGGSGWYKKTLMLDRPHSKNQGYAWKFPYMPKLERGYNIRRLRCSTLTCLQAERYGKIVLVEPWISLHILYRSNYLRLAASNSKARRISRRSNGYRILLSSYPRLLDHALINAALSSTVNPTLFTLPKRANASPTLSKTLFSSALTSPGWSLRLFNVSVLLVIAESTPKVSRKLVE